MYDIALNKKICEKKLNDTYEALDSLLTTESSVYNKNKIEAYFNEACKLEERYENILMSELTTEKVDMEEEIKPIVNKLNEKGFTVKYASPGHVRLRKEKDKDKDGVYYSKLYSDARIMFDNKYKLGEAPKGWKFREVDGCSYLDIVPKTYDNKKGAPYEAFVKWKAEYMKALDDWVIDRCDGKKAEKEKDDKDADTVKESVNNYFASFDPKEELVEEAKGPSFGKMVDKVLDGKAIGKEVAMVGGVTIAAIWGALQSINLMHMASDKITTEFQKIHYNHIINTYYNWKLKDKCPKLSELKKKKYFSNELADKKNPILGLLKKYGLGRENAVIAFATKDGEDVCCAYIDKKWISGIDVLSSLLSQGVVIKWEITKHIQFKVAQKYKKYEKYYEAAMCLKAGIISNYMKDICREFKDFEREHAEEFEAFKKSKKEKVVKEGYDDYKIIKGDVNGGHVVGIMPDGSEESFDTVKEFHDAYKKAESGIKEESASDDINREYELMMLEAGFRTEE